MSYHQHHLSEPKSGQFNERNKNNNNNISEINIAETEAHRWNAIVSIVYAFRTLEKLTEIKSKNKLTKRMHIRFVIIVIILFFLFFLSFFLSSFLFFSCFPLSFFTFHVPFPLFLPKWIL